MRLASGIHVPDYYRRDYPIEIIDPLKMPPLPDVGRMPAVIPQRCAAGWVADIASVSGNLDTNNKLDITVGGSGVAQGSTLMVFGYRYINSTGDVIATITDSQGNTYTVDSPGTNIGNNKQCGVGSGYMTTALGASDYVRITWTNASAVSYFGGQLVEYSGCASASWFDKAAAAAAFRTQAQGITSGATATLDGSNDLVFGIIGLELSTETLSAGSGYTSRTAVANGTVGIQWRPEDKVLSGDTSAQTVTGSWVSGNQQEFGICVCIKAAAAGGGGKGATEAAAVAMAGAYV